MHIEQTIRRGRRLSLTSLIDVIFLLLLFFMLSSTFTKFGEVEINAGQSGSSSSNEKPGILITIERDTWRVNGQSLDPASALSTLNRLTATQPQTAVMLVRGETNSQQMVNAVEQLAKLKNLTLSVAR